jgi:metal-responsive CopG/Arc/MetJ family transcriptional regulator
MTENFDQLLAFKVPTRLGQAIDRVAATKALKRSEYIRQAVVEALKRDGVLLHAAA